MSNAKLLLAETYGIDESYIELFEVYGSGVMVQFCKSVRGTYTLDHDDNEYIYFSTHYGLVEVFDIFVAKNFNNAFDKMVRITKELDIETLV